MYFECVIGASAMIVSILYHGSETVGTKSVLPSFGRVLGMTPGNWHRLDNVFSILGFCCLALWFMDNQSHKVEELVRWTLLVICLWYVLFL